MDYTCMCPRYYSAIDILGKKWTCLILRVLMSGPKRFKEIKEQIPEMSDRILTERMKELEQLDIVVRNVYPETPVRIEYQLTAKGRALKDVVQSIQQWAEAWT
ncbi:winged helix-turn-helix transcriptional regulator [Marinicrinis sediminis]|uniref:Winged helix-turn-helix transcriptional regulator n=1 Tax=Marinicrinis sediminis TaxID=1652465 RepID=A0ABW5R5K3_9BACL